MRKYRCPHCGEECITAYQKFVSKGQGAIECKICHEGIFHKPKYENSLHYVYDILMYIVLLLLIVVMLMTKKYILLILVVFWGVLYHYSKYIYPYLFYAFVKQRYTVLFPYENDFEANAVIELENTKAVDNFDIFAIKFKTSTDNVKFHEAFMCDEVPTVFYKSTRKQSNPICIKIMKTDFIPDELLRVGANFAVISNHKEVTTGKIIKFI